MKMKLFCSSEEWLFLRRFSYFPFSFTEYDYASPSFFQKFYSHEPKPNTEICWIELFPNGIGVNISNKPEETIFLPWDLIRSIRPYYLMHPFDSATLNIITPTDMEHVVTIRYLNDMKEKYPLFHYYYQPMFEDKFCLLLETRKGVCQIALPVDWVDGEEIKLLFSEIEKRKMIEWTLPNDEDDFWKSFGF